MAKSLQYDTKYMEGFVTAEDIEGILPEIEKAHTMLKDKVCFVSGAAKGRGNGRSIALKLADQGAHVAVGDIRYEEAQAVAESTMAGIMGREAVYSGRAVDWDTAIKSTTRLGPEQYELGPYPIPPVAMPGQYRFT